MHGGVQPQGAETQPLPLRQKRVTTSPVEFPSASILDAQKQLRVVDVCSGPGSITSYTRRQRLHCPAKELTTAPSSLAAKRTAHTSPSTNHTKRRSTCGRALVRAARLLNGNGRSSLLLTPLAQMLISPCRPAVRLKPHRDAALFDQL
jgi:hypothetical protein